MSMRDIKAHLHEIYGTEVSPELISTVTDGVMEEVRAWQNRPLERLYPIVYMDAMVVKVKDNGHVRHKALYLALGITLEGRREILGLWMSANEGAKFWLQVLTELKNRGVQDIFIACIDGLKGFPEAIQATFPHTQIQLCIVHLIRSSTRLVPWKERRNVIVDLKAIYQAPSEEAAREALENFKKKWDGRFPIISQTWENHWQHMSPFLAYPEHIRRIIYTTNIIEATHRQVRKTIKTKGAFPNEDAVFKIVYLSLKNAQTLWKQQPRDWLLALNQFAILFQERFPQ